MDYWRDISKAWRISPAQAKKSRCGNCAAFIQTPKMLACIESGLEMNGTEMDAWEVIDAGDLGYCEVFDADVPSLKEEIALPPNIRRASEQIRMSVSPAAICHLRCKNGLPPVVQ